MAEVKVEQIMTNGTQNVVILKITEGCKTVFVPVQGYNSMYTAQNVARGIVRGY